MGAHRAETRLRPLRWRCDGAVLRALAAAILALALTLCPGSAEPADRSVVFVVNSSGPLARITVAQIRDIYLGRLHVIDGIHVRPIQVEGRARELVLDKLLKMSESEFQLYWMRKTFEDGVLPPPLRDTTEQVVRFVRSEAGAIGFVEKAGVGTDDSLTVVYEIAP